MFKAAKFKHVRVLDAKVDAAGKPSTNPLAKCLYCNKQFAGGSYRIRGHLLGLKWGIAACPSVPESVKGQFQGIQDGKDLASEKKRKLTELNAFSQSTGSSRDRATSIQSNQPTMHEAFKVGRKENCDDRVARFFIAKCILFQKIESPYFKEMLAAVSQHGPGYLPPRVDRLRTKLLDNDVSFVKAELQPHMDAMHKTGATLCSDGWSDVRNHPLLNMVLVTHKGAVFDSAINTEDHVKDAEYVCEKLSDVIQRVGVKNIVQVVTDSAANCVRAGKLLMERYPIVIWVPCVAHCMDLLLEDIGRLDWVKEIIEPGKDVVKFITNHQTSLAIFAIFRKHSDKQFLRPGETRFATNFIMLQRLKEVRKELQKTVLDEAWESWVERDRYRVEESADTCKKAVMDNAFFRKLDDLLALARPAIELMRMADADVPSTGKIYWSCYSLLEHASRFQALTPSKREQLKKIVTHRWEMLHSPLHTAGYALDPEFQDHDVETNEEVMTGFHDMLEKIFPDSPEDQAIAVQQFASFRQKTGMFARANAAVNAQSMPAHSWWSMYGSTVPQLQKVAICVLSQTTSACSCERNWSAYDYIHSKKRNRLDPVRAEKLVYVFSNLRLLKNMEALDYKEQCWTWDDHEADHELAEDFDDVA